MREILYEEAMAALAACKEAADSMSLPCVTVVMDNSGLIIAQARLDRVPTVCIDVAERKAYTAAVYGMPTAALAGLCQPGGPFFGLQSLSGGRYVIFGGGVPVIRDGRCVGSVGVSGGSLEQDAIIAAAGVAAIG